jgi:hypothetical protein
MGSLEGQHVEKVKAASLSELLPRTYSTVKARVVIIKCKQKEDELGKRDYIFGICEDATFRVPFICYKPYPLFFHDAVFEFNDCYVHEFDEKSLLLVVTERSSIGYLANEDPHKYVWHPVIGDIKRATGSCRITLQGTLSQISGSSGLVERCETCGRVAFDGRCPNGHEDKLFPAVRIAGRLADASGSMNVVFSQYLACKLLGRTIGEILQLTEGSPTYPRGPIPESFAFQIPDQIEVIEAYAEDPDEFRSARSPIVVDLNESRIIHPNNLTPQGTFGAETKKLDLSKPEDRRDLARLAEKLIQIRIQSATGFPKINNLYLTEDPIPLYRAESAKLHVGFKIKVRATEERQLLVDAVPCAEVFESVLDYVEWRRQRGASPNAIKRAMLNYRKNAVFAPYGELGCVVDLQFKKAGEFVVPAYDLSLPDFWQKVHSIDVNPEERPLVVLKSYRYDLELTFPPSCVFYDRHSLRLSYGAQRFIERKHHQARGRTREVLSQALSGFMMGDFRLEPLQPTNARTGARELLLADIREKLLGRSVKATGAVIEANNRLYFIPRRVDGVF